MPSGYRQLIKVVAPAGSATQPGLFFAGDSSSGLYRSAVDTIDFTSAGTRVATVDGSGVVMQKALAQFIGLQGTKTAPAFTFSGRLSTGFYSSAADTVDVTAGDTRVATFDAAGFTMQTAGDAIVPAAASGTPVAHGLYRGNVPKAWAVITYSGGTPTLANNFNVSGITDEGAGDVTVTWDRDFGDANEAVVATGFNSGANNTHYQLAEAPAVGSCRVHAILAGTGALDDPNYVSVVAFGGQ